MLLYVHRNHTDCKGRRAQNGHLCFRSVKEAGLSNQLLGMHVQREREREAGCVVGVERLDGASGPTTRNQNVGLGKQHWSFPGAVTKIPQAGNARRRTVATVVWLRMPAVLAGLAFMKERFPPYWHWDSSTGLHLDLPKLSPFTFSFWPHLHVPTMYLYPPNKWQGME